MNSNSRSNGLGLDSNSAPSESCGGGAALAATEGSRRRFLNDPEDLEEVDVEDFIAEQKNCLSQDGYGSDFLNVCVYVWGMGGEGAAESRGMMSRNASVNG